MAPSPAVCSSCQTPLPADAQFCPHCGTRTPTQISGGGTASVAIPPAQLDEQQRRLQAALGPDYAVERLIGSGGFAAVWATFDRKLQRRVAVKVLHPELVATRSLLERFQREAQAVAKLRHPGVIPIYAVGEHEGLAYYVMPLIEGETLRQRLNREGALATDEARRILREGAAALAVAHEAGIVHRDVKPENLMLEGKDRRVVVMDFGIAKSTAGAQTGLTATGLIIGTPAYMSPEQAAGSKEVGVRSDVYSLGVVGFEMLTGDPPFEAASVPELVLKQVATPAPSVAVVRADTPEDLAIAVNRCLQKDPDERWRDAGALSAFLERPSAPATQGAVVSRDLRRFVRRRWRPSRRQVMWAGVGAAALAVAGLVGISPARLRVSAHYWGERLGLARVTVPLVPDRPEQPATQMPNALFQGFALPMGGSGLAVIDTRDGMRGLHLFDGSRWRTWRTLEPIGAATPQGDHILLFSSRREGHVFRWSPDGITRLDTLPFGVAAAWADSAGAIVFGNGRSETAQWDARGWRRMPSRRRVWLGLLAGSSRSALVALGDFSWTGVPDSVGPDSLLEFDGTIWQSVDPRPKGTAEHWDFETAAALGDGSLVVGGLAGRQPARPLVLARSGPRAWRRIPVPADALPGVYGVVGIAGASLDDLLLWANCDSGCPLIEVRQGQWGPASDMGKGSVFGVVRVGDAVYAIWSDGTVWARRGGSWVYATEVPTTPDRCRFCALDAYGSVATRDSAPTHVVGAVTNRALGWVLGGDGIVRRVSCRALSSCAASREPFYGVGYLRAQGREMIAAGARGLVALGDTSGRWRRISLPGPAAAESVTFAQLAPGGGLVVLTSRHYAVLGSSGAPSVSGSIDAQAKAVGAWSLSDGTVLVGYRDRLARMRGDSALKDWQLYSNLTDGCSLVDGRIILGMGGDPSDPFSEGALLVFSADSGLSDAVAISRRPRTRVLSVECIGDRVFVRTPSGSIIGPDHLPFARTPQPSGAPSAGPR